MIALILALIAPVSAEEMPSGTLEYVHDGRTHHLPMVRTEVDADLHGDEGILSRAGRRGDGCEVPAEQHGVCAVARR